jgi:hypothetical protein
MFSPQAQEIIRKQQVADKIGTLALSQIVEMKQRQAQGPQSLAEAQQLIPGVIQPVEEQRGAALDQLVGQGMQGPTQAVDPRAALTTAQQKLAGETIEGLGRGSLMRTPEGIVPTQFAGIQGRMVTPEQLAAADAAAITPPSQPLQQSPVPLPAQLANEILQQRGRLQQQLIKPPDVTNLSEEISLARFDRPFRALKPIERTAVRNETEKTLQDRVRFQQGELMARTIAQTAPVFEEKAKAERQQPVGGAVSNYARLSPDGTIERPADGTLSQDDLNKSGFVDISKHQKEVDGLNDLNVIEQDFRKLKSYADELFTAGSGLSSRVGQGGKLFIAKLANSGKPTRIIGSNGQPLTVGELANIYNDEVTSMLEYYGRNLKGLRGAATEGDVARMRKNFASEFTSRAVKDKLMDDTLKLIQNIKIAGHKTIFGDKAVSKTKRTPEQQQSDMRARIQQLMSQGLSDEEIERQLTNP